MKKILLIAGLVLSVSIQAQTFTLKSNNLGGQATNSEIFNGFGCTGENNSPQLSWENAPEGTKSFAVVMHDEDAPTGSGWWHWLAFDIPNNVSELHKGAGNPENELMPKQAIQSKTDFGTYGYGGPCPPQGHGFHKYTITVYALPNESLGLNKDVSPALVSFYLNGNALAKASIVFYHKRDK